MEHIRDEILSLTEAFEGVTFETFAASYVLRRSSEHALLIISEAVRTLPPDLTGAYPQIDWRAIRDIGSVIRHEYFEVDMRVIWRVVRDRFPELKLVTDAMIASSGS